MFINKFCVQALWPIRSGLPLTPFQYHEATWSSRFPSWMGCYSMARFGSTAINLPVPIKYLPGWLKALPERRIQLSSLSQGSTLDIQCTLLGHSPFSRKPLTQWSDLAWVAVPSLWSLSDPDVSQHFSSNCFGYFTFFICAYFLLYLSGFTEHNTCPFERTWYLLPHSTAVWDAESKSLKTRTKRGRN